MQARENIDTRSPQPGSNALLNDTPSRDYALKLTRFNEFAAPEIRRAMATLGPAQGLHILDVGCGSGEALRWFHESLHGSAVITGMDLAFAHVAAARATSPPGVLIVQADLLRPPFPNAAFDLIWCVNTVNHLKRSDDGLAVFRSLLKKGGRVALGQSSFLPDMFFAWDARLERVITEAVRSFYRDRYGLSERDVSHIRGLVGLLKRAGLRDVRADTFIIERVYPLNQADERYMIDVLFREMRGERLRPYLSDEDFEQLKPLSDADHPDFAPRRPDFHFLQTFSLVVGSV